MEIKKIITHDGIFHADEVMAIALIHEFVDGGIPVERTRTISTEDMEDPNVWVIDVGGEYNPSLGLFDHHHDDSLEASCVLIATHLFLENIYNDDMFLELRDTMHVISEIDTGGYTQYNGFQFNSLIKMFNSLDNGWQLALDTCRNYIKCLKDNVDKIEQSRRIWDEGERISMHIKYCHEFPIHWKRYDDSAVMYLIYPNKGKFNLLSKDSKDFPICSSGDEEFLHNAKFLAVFSSKEDAIRCARLSEVNIVG